MSKEPLEDIEIYQEQYNKLIALFSELALLGEQDGYIRRTDHMTADTIITMMNVFGQFKILKKLFLDQLRA
jgi:hypothetical protein